MNNHEDVFDLPDEDLIPLDENDDYADRLDDGYDDFDERDYQIIEEEKSEQDSLKEDLNRLEGEGGKVINGPNNGPNK